MVVSNRVVVRQRGRHHTRKEVLQFVADAELRLKAYIASAASVDWSKVQKVGEGLAELRRWAEEPE